MEFPPIPGKEPKKAIKTGKPIGKTSKVSSTGTRNFI